MTAKEIQDAGKQDSDANVNRVKAEKVLIEMQITLAVRLIEKLKRNPEVEKGVASAPLRTRAKEMPSFWENMRQIP